MVVCIRGFFLSLKNQLKSDVSLSNQAGYKYYHDLLREPVYLLSLGIIQGATDIRMRGTISAS